MLPSRPSTGNRGGQRRSGIAGGGFGGGQAGRAVGVGGNQDWSSAAALLRRNRAAAVHSARVTPRPKDEAAKVAENVRQIGRKAFYRQGDRWVDSAVTRGTRKEKPIKVERFSKEYFDLIDKYGRDVAKYLAFDEPVTVELGGQAYEID